MTYGEQVGSLRRTLHRALVRHLAERSERPFSQLLALRAISRGEVETQVELAERLVIDAPAASRLVAGLEKEKLIKRTQGEDRRCVCLQVSPLAKKEIAIIDEGLDWLEAQVSAHLAPKDMESSKALMARLQQAIQGGAQSTEPTRRAK